jgi:spermidine/putrescine transport system substrate-binding protein
MMKKYKNRDLVYTFFLIFFIVIFLFFIKLNFSQIFKTDKINETISKELNILNWDDYTATPEILEKFTNETEVKVNIDTYDFTEEVFEKNLSKYDLVLIAENQIEDFKKKKILTKLDSKYLYHTELISSECNLSKPNSNYFIPYVWGTTGVIVNEDLIPDHGNSWDILWSDIYKKKTMMILSAEEIITANSMNTLSKPYPENLYELNNLINFIIFQDKRVYGYYNDLEDLSTLFENESIWAVQAYTGDLASVETTKNLKYFIPVEGTMKWIDGFIIPKTSPNKYTAYLFANFLLQEENNAEIAEYYEIPTCNENAKLYLSEDFLSNVAIYPTDDVKDKLKFVSDYEMIPELAELNKKIIQRINENKSIIE